MCTFFAKFGISKPYRDAYLGAIFVQIDISYESASCWSGKGDKAMVEEAEYEILVGNSVKNTNSSGRFAVKEACTYQA
jgi:hypothetical protein